MRRNPIDRDLDLDSFYEYEAELRRWATEQATAEKSAMAALFMGGVAAAVGVIAAGPGGSLLLVAGIVAYARMSKKGEAQHFANCERIEERYRRRVQLLTDAGKHDPHADSFSSSDEAWIDELCAQVTAQGKVQAGPCIISGNSKGKVGTIRVPLRQAGKLVAVVDLKKVDGIYSGRLEDGAQLTLNRVSSKQLEEVLDTVTEHPYVHALLQ